MKLDLFVFRFCCWRKGHVLSISEPDQQTPRPLLSKSAMWWPRQWPHFKACAQFVSLERFSKNLEIQSLSSPLSRFVMWPLANPFSRLRFWFGLFIFHLGLPFRRRAKKERRHANMLNVQRSAIVKHCVPQYSLSLVARYCIACAKIPSKNSVSSRCVDASGWRGSSERGRGTRSWGGGAERGSII